MGDAVQTPDSFKTTIDDVLEGVEKLGARAGPYHHLLRHGRILDFLYDPHLYPSDNLTSQKEVAKHYVQFIANPSLRGTNGLSDEEALSRMLQVMTEINLAHAAIVAFGGIFLRRRYDEIGNEQPL